MLKTHLRDHGGQAFCAVRPGKTPLVTTKINEVTCKYCHNKIKSQVDRLGYYNIIYKHGEERVYPESP